MADIDHLNPDFKTRLMALVAASHGRISIGSAFRSVQEQTTLWNAAVQKYGSPQAARKWVAPPGSSHHNVGIAADLQGDLALAHQLAPQFGLYFPMPWEKWHIEPIGSGANQKSMTTTPDWYKQSVAQQQGQGAGQPTAKQWSLDDQLGAIGQTVNHVGQPTQGDDVFSQAMDMLFANPASDPAAEAVKANEQQPDVSVPLPAEQQTPAPTAAPAPVTTAHRDRPVRMI